MRKQPNPSPPENIVKPKPPPSPPKSLEKKGFMPKVEDVFGRSHEGFWKDHQKILFKCKDLIIKYELGHIEKDEFIDIMKRLLFEY